MQFRWEFSMNFVKIRTKTRITEQIELLIEYRHRIRLISTWKSNKNSLEPNSSQILIGSNDAQIDVSLCSCFSPNFIKLQTFFSSRKENRKQMNKRQETCLSSGAGIRDKNHLELKMRRRKIFTQKMTLTFHTFRNFKVEEQKGCPVFSTCLLVRKSPSFRPNLHGQINQVESMSLKCNFQAVWKNCSCHCDSFSIVRMEWNISPFFSFLSTIISASEHTLFVCVCWYSSFRMLSKMFLFHLLLNRCQLIVRWVSMCACCRHKLLVATRHKPK